MLDPDGIYLSEKIPASDKAPFWRKLYGVRFSAYIFLLEDPLLEFFYELLLLSGVNRLREDLELSDAFKFCSLLEVIKRK